VVTVDTLRNIIENVYFGTYFGAQYGLFSSNIAEVLGNPALLIMPKLMNIVAACAVLWLLLLRWLPWPHASDPTLKLSCKTKQMPDRQTGNIERIALGCGLALILFAVAASVLYFLFPQSERCGPFFAACCRNASGAGQAR